MNKQKFISELKESLEGRVPDRIIRENVQYYRTYLTDEAKASNRTEEEVIEDLGSPRLIARTIVDAYEAEFGPYEGQEVEFHEEKSRNAQDDEDESRHVQFNSCLAMTLVVVLVALLLLFTIFRLIFSLPGIVICLIVLLLFWYFSDSRR